MGYPHSPTYSENNMLATLPFVLIKRCRSRRELQGLCQMANTSMFPKFRCRLGISQEGHCTFCGSLLISLLLIVTGRLSRSLYCSVDNIKISVRCIYTMNRGGFRPLWVITAFSASWNCSFMSCLCAKDWNYSALLLSQESAYP